MSTEVLTHFDYFSCPRSWLHAKSNDWSRTQWNSCSIRKYPFDNSRQTQAVKWTNHNFRRMSVARAERGKTLTSPPLRMCFDFSSIWMRNENKCICFFNLWSIVKQYRIYCIKTGWAFILRWNMLPAVNHWILTFFISNQIKSNCLNSITRGVVLSLIHIWRCRRS